MTNRFIAILLALALAAHVFLLWQVDKLRADFTEQRVAFSLWKASMQTLTTSWTSGGVTHTVTTTRLSGEGDEAFARRHADAVSAMQKLYPPN